MSFAVALAALSACSSDSGGNGTQDMGPDVERDTGTDTTPDTAPDTTPDTTPDATPDAPTFIPNETEPNDPDNPNDITLPADILGQIGTPEFDPEAGSTPDVDAFRFTAQAGTVLRMTLAQSNIEPYIIVVTEDQEADVQIFRLLSGTTPGGTRQLFIPVTGTYLVIVQDYRNDGQSEPVGGDEYIYELQLETESVTPESATLPLAETATALPANNGVRILELTVDEAGLFLADTDAFDKGTDLDTALVLMNDDLTAVVAENDDEDYGGGLYDSLIHTDIDTGTYNLVVDFYEVAGSNAVYDMTVRVADPAVEEEPTDAPNNAWPLPIAAAAADPFVVTGTIEEPTTDENGDDVPDLDWFDLGDLLAGDSVVITVDVPAGSALQPRLFAGTVFDGFLGPEPFFTRTLAGPDGTLRFELTAEYDGPYFAVVSDDRNFAPDDAADDFVLEAVGGSTYTYEISAQEFTRSEEALGATPASTSSTLASVGSVNWYTFSPASDGLLLVTVKNANFEPTVWLLDRTNADGDPFEIGDLLEIGDQFLLTEGVTDTPLQLALFNETEWPAEGAATFDLGVEIVQQELGQEADVEGGDFPDSTETALGLPAAGANYEGTLDGTSDADADHDVFEIELLAGARLFVETYGPLPDDAAEPGNADTILTLEGPGLDEPLENDDFNGLFSRIEYDVPDDGAGVYTITVMPYCSDTECDGGAYGIRVLVLGAIVD